MNNKSVNKAAKLQIVHALVWAALMLAVSWVSKDNGNQQVIFFMICGWLTTQGLLQNALGEKKTPTACCKPKTAK